MKRKHISVDFALTTIWEIFTDRAPATRARIWNFDRAKRWQTNPKLIMKEILMSSNEEGTIPYNKARRILRQAFDHTSEIYLLEKWQQNYIKKENETH